MKWRSQKEAYYNKRPAEYWLLKNAFKITWNIFQQSLFCIFNIRKTTYNILPTNCWKSTIMFLKMKKAKFHYILKSIFTSFAYVKWLSEVTQSNKLKHSKNNYLSSSAVCVMSSFEKLLQKVLLTKCLKKVVFLKTLYKHFQKKCLILLCNMLIDASLLHLF